MARRWMSLASADVSFSLYCFVLLRCSKVKAKQRVFEGPRQRSHLLRLQSKRDVAGCRALIYREHRRAGMDLLPVKGSETLRMYISPDDVAFVIHLQKQKPLFLKDLHTAHCKFPAKQVAFSSRGESVSQLPRCSKTGDGSLKEGYMSVRLMSLSRVLPTSH